MKIIIIGAGIAGLTLGLACERAGIDYKIYEKTKSLKNIGGGIILWPHGVRFLQWLNLDDCLQSLNISVAGCRVLGNAGDSIFNEAFTNLSAAIGGTPLPVDRSALQHLLLAQVPAHKIEFDKHLIAIAHGTDDSTTIFADGHQDSGDMIVGADGIHSVTRNTFNDVELQYTGHSWWGGIIEQASAAAFAKDHVSFMVGLKKVAVIWPLINNKFMWYIPVSKALSQAQTLHDTCVDWNTDIQQVINASSGQQNFHVPIHVLPPQSRIINRRTVLIGDAAHAMGPILGLGASLAIEDVYALINAITHNIPLENYNALRVARYAKLAELEKQSAETMINESQDLLEEFEFQLQDADLLLMYQELIPLINENACNAITQLFTRDILAA